MSNTVYYLICACFRKVISANYVCNRRTLLEANYGIDKFGQFVEQHQYYLSILYKYYLNLLIVTTATQESYLLTVVHNIYYFC